MGGATDERLLISDWQVSGASADWSRWNHWYVVCCSSRWSFIMCRPEINARVREINCRQHVLRTFCQCSWKCIIIKDKNTLLEYCLLAEIVYVTLDSSILSLFCWFLKQFINSWTVFKRHYSFQNVQRTHFVSWDDVCNHKSTVSFSVSLRSAGEHAAPALQTGESVPAGGDPAGESGARVLWGEMQ